MQIESVLKMYAVKIHSKYGYKTHGLFYAGIRYYVKDGSIKHEHTFTTMQNEAYKFESEKLANEMKAILNNILYDSSDVCVVCIVVNQK